MTAEIVQLRTPGTIEPEPRIWTCAHCSCQTFYLYDDDTVECALCNTRDASGGGWLAQLPPDADLDPGTPVRTRTASGAVDFQRIAMAKKIEQGDGVSAALIVEPDGSIQLWKFDCERPQDTEWLENVFMSAAGLVSGKPPVSHGPKPE